MKYLFQSIENVLGEKIPLDVLAPKTLFLEAGNQSFTNRDYSDAVNENENDDQVDSGSENSNLTRNDEVVKKENDVKIEPIENGPKSSRDNNKENDPDAGDEPEDEDYELEELNANISVSRQLQSNFLLFRTFKDFIDLKSYFFR